VFTLNDSSLDFIKFLKDWVQIPPGSTSIPGYILLFPTPGSGVGGRVPEVVGAKDEKAIGGAANVLISFFPLLGFMGTIRRHCER
jgi:hypothetical protein